MAGFLLLLLIGLCVYAGWLVFGTVIGLTRPTRRTYAWAVSRGVPGDPGEMQPARRFEACEFGSASMSIAGWEIEGDDPLGPVVVLTHGWSDSKIGALFRVEALAPVASRLIAWDLRGHGESGGTCTLGLREFDDLSALLAAVTGGEGGPGVVLHGWSLGAGLSIAAAAANRVRILAVIAEAPYRLPATPARNVIRARGMPWRLNLPLALAWIGLGNGGWNGFDRAEIAGRMRCPLLVLHGAEDAISPRADAEAIGRAAVGGELLEIAGAGHNNMWTQEPAARTATEAIRRFLARALHPVGDAAFSPHPSMPSTTCPPRPQGC